MEFFQLIELEFMHKTGYSLYELVKDYGVFIWCLLGGIALTAQIQIWLKKPEAALNIKD